MTLVALLVAPVIWIMIGVFCVTGLLRDDTHPYTPLDRIYICLCVLLWPIILVSVAAVAYYDKCREYWER